MDVTFRALNTRLVLRAAVMAVLLGASLARSTQAAPAGDCLAPNPALAPTQLD
ncbi:MAG: hypothetical protein IT189_12110 [Microbacteriaceae bacterium]|nr:hypothetical protein [Microbacteriaceae bacterium]